MTTTVRRAILQLPPETASRIAAGEVVERPLSALKELLENALDAESRSIEIRVERSLDHVLQVADDGVGIPADAIELAFERHATSKLRDLDDLDRLASLGFRGEALPSIAAVSRVRVTSRVREADDAVRLTLEGGEVQERAAAARAPGTTIEMRDLFFNTPARRKFLNAPAGELRAALRLLECYALAFPEVGFRMEIDGRERVAWGAAASRRERATQIWGARHAAQRLEAEGERDGIEVAALLGLPEHARATRDGQVFLINRRWVASAALGQALRQAYGNLLPPGRFPSAVVWLRVPPERLDVNIHPTKREVRFADEGTAFKLVAATCAKPLASIRPPFTVVQGGQPEPAWADRVRERPSDQTQLGLEGPPRPPAAQAPAAAPAPPGPAEPELWQLHRTYLLAPVRGGLVIIDQHAAHERVLYEQAVARLEGEAGTSQQLLFPALVDLTHAQFELLLESLPLLERLGWDLAPLGPPTVVLRGAPAEVRREHPAAFLQDVLDGVSEAGGQAGRPLADAIARSYACHAAIKAGDPLTPPEMRSLVDQLFATSRPHGDPHGRVTYVRLDLDELHRRFGRG